MRVLHDFDLRLNIGLLLELYGAKQALAVLIFAAAVLALLLDLGVGHSKWFAQVRLDLRRLEAVFHVLHLDLVCLLTVVFVQII